MESESNLHAADDEYSLPVSFPAGMPPTPNNHVAHPPRNGGSVTPIDTEEAFALDATAIAPISQPMKSVVAEVSEV